MIATVQYVQRRFDEFNKTIFKGKLPQIPIIMAQAKTFMGKFECRSRITPNGKRKFYDYKLRINNSIDFPPDTLDDVIIHEMIHYSLAYYGIQDTTPHGIAFRKLMNAINTNFGRHITISHRLLPGQRRTPASGTSGYKVVAVVTLTDDTRGIKVLPRVIETILEYYNGIMGSGKAKSIEMWVSNDAFFDTYPRSGALRVYPLSPEVISEHLKDAIKIECDGSTVKQP